MSLQKLKIQFLLFMLQEQEFKNLSNYVDHDKYFKKFRFDVVTRWNSVYNIIHDAYPSKIY